MWFGTEDGLDKYDGNDFTVYRHDPNKPDTLSANTITALYEDSSGTLWVATTGGGLDSDRDTGRFIHYRGNPDVPTASPPDLIRSIYEDRSGVLWIGTESGMSQFDRRSERFSSLAATLTPLWR